MASGVKERSGAYILSFFWHLYLFIYLNSWFTMFCQFLLYRKVAESYIYIHFFFLTLSSIVFRHKWLDMAPCAIEQDLIAYLLQMHPLTPIPLLIYLFIFHFTAPAAYGRFQARGQIWAAAASPHLSHHHAGSRLPLYPMLQLAATLNPLNEARDPTHIFTDTVSDS